MPFTLAHPAGALPLKWIKKDWFSTTGLVVGSMAPDYEYFLKQYPSPSLGETLWGALLFDLPLALIVALIFHLLVKRPLIRNLPQPYDHRLSGYAQTSFLAYLGKHWLVFVFSMLLGIASHFLLDWSTHPFKGPLGNTAFTEVVTIGSLRTRPLIVAERTFDVVGTLVLFLLIMRLNKPASAFTKASATNKWIFWILLFITIGLLLAWNWFEKGGFEGVGVGVTVLIWAVAAGLVASSVLIRLLERGQHRS
ncbi:DUF4184 family protein [Cesiribacter sp. SM1]|uniref:DUF4184 family protein n=1 Tax=Cesiribacter sp. SM1 TaxID=2861196 RepID=UPI001CD6439B|nr:DUF4184 family protein [Cesiribacter sp. SM1]